MVTCHLPWNRVSVQQWHEFANSCCCRELDLWLQSNLKLCVHNEDVGDGYVAQAEVSEVSVLHAPFTTNAIFTLGAKLHHHLILDVDEDILHLVSVVRCQQVEEDMLYMAILP